MPQLEPPSHEDVRREERKRRLRVLLESRLDYLPPPPGPRLAAKPGPAPSRYVPCETCHGRGRVFRGRGKKRTDRICLICDGSGRTPERRPERQTHDEYLGRGNQAGGSYDSRRGRLGVDEKPRLMEPREVDAELRRIAADERSRAGDIGHERHGWERAHELQDKSGSYADLERAIAALRQARPLLPLESEEALVLLERAMPASIRVPRWAEGVLAEQRLEVVRELSEWWGWSSREIGRALGLSGEKVRRLLKSPPRTV